MYLTELENIPEKIKTDVLPNRIYTYSSVDPLTATTTAQQLFRIIYHNIAIISRITYIMPSSIYFNIGRNKNTSPSISISSTRNINT
jgi:hypothetical protein